MAEIAMDFDRVKEAFVSSNFNYIENNIDKWDVYSDVLMSNHYAGGNIINFCCYQKNYRIFSLFFERFSQQCNDMVFENVNPLILNNAVDKINLNMIYYLLIHPRGPNYMDPRCCSTEKQDDFSLMKNMYMILQDLDQWRQKYFLEDQDELFLHSFIRRSANECEPMFKLAKVWVCSSDFCKNPEYLELARKVASIFLLWNPNTGALCIINLCYSVTIKMNIIIVIQILDTILGWDPLAGVKNIEKHFVTPGVSCLLAFVTDFSFLYQKNGAFHFEYLLILTRICSCLKTYCKKNGFSKLKETSFWRQWRLPDGRKITFDGHFVKFTAVVHMALDFVYYNQAKIWEIPIFLFQKVLDIVIDTFGVDDCVVLLDQNDEEKTKKCL